MHPTGLKRSALADAGSALFADNTSCEAQVSSPTCFESRGGAPKPVIVKISSKEPADVIPPIGFDACYKDTVGSTYKCLAFSIIQSCADSSQLAMGSPIATPGSGGGLPPPCTGRHGAKA